MLRDRIVVGIRDATLSEKLQMDSNLTLEQAVNKVRHSEAVKQQQTLLHNKSELGVPSNVDAVLQRPPSTKPRRGNKPAQNRSKQQQTSGQNMCTRCGRTPWHSREDCPVKTQKCNKCGKIGHYAKMCKTKAVHGLEAREPAPNEMFTEAFLGTIHTNSNKQGNWMLNLQVNGYKVTFKMDTGAEVTVISKQIYDNIPGEKSLTQPNKVLYGVGSQPLEVLGSFPCKLQHKGKTFQDEVYVIQSMVEPLLGIEAIDRLELAVRVTNIGKQPDFKAEFPKLFQGLGKMDKEFEIKLKPGVTPYNLPTPRRISLPLLDKVREELGNMEAGGVISKVNKPTDWCAGIVVVEKNKWKGENLCRSYQAE